MIKKSEVMEITEARRAGEKALEALQEAREYLHTAKNLGLWDMLGGGLLASMLKHSKMEKATQSMETAKARLREFQKELKDIELPWDFKLDIGSFLTFADYFFDGLVSDWMVQNKIEDAGSQVEEAVCLVQSVIEDLERMEHMTGIE